MFKFSLINAPESFDFTPARQRPVPELAEAEPAPDAGPVIITTTYRFAPPDRPEFAAIMDELSRIRRREGAIRVGLYVDLADPTRLVEYFMVESWEEYEQLHDRGVSREEAEVKTRARALHFGPELPRVARLLGLHPEPAPPLRVMVPGSTRHIASTAGETAA